MSGFKEVDMYEPVKQFFLDMDFQVFGEVKDCDMAMIKAEELVIIELKRHFSVDLLMQAIDRQKVSNQVYIAIPRPKSCKGKRYTSMVELVKRLDLGLIFIAMETTKLVDIPVYPPEATIQNFTKRNKIKREALLNEINNRTGDYNVGGSSKVPIITAFRESNIKIATALFLEGPLSPKELQERFHCDKRCGQALYRNYYGWFNRVSHGLYMLTDIGMDMIENEFTDIVTYYTKEIEGLLLS